MRRITFSVCMSVAACGALVAVSPAVAQNRCYRIIDLDSISSGNPAAPFGINNQNQAVYSVDVDPGGGVKFHAFLYLPAPAYGFTEPGCYDLHELAGLDADESSAAHDINESGIVVGYRTVNLKRRAFIWRLDLNDPMNPPVPFIDLGTFPSGDSSVAYAVNDNQPFPWIVGTGIYGGDCGCQGGETHPLQLAFATRLDVAPLGLGVAATLIRDPEVGCHPNSVAWDINTAQVRTVAGHSRSGGAPCENEPGSRATVWTDPILGANNNGIALVELPGIGSDAQGASNLGPIVGVGHNSELQDHAVYWDAVGGPIVDLGSLLPLSTQSWAWRINNLSNRDVVGTASSFFSATRDGAALWECSSNCNQIPGSDWSVTDLGSALISDDCNSRWQLRDAFDVNDAGYIIAWGWNPSGPHAVILEPDEPCCPADLDDNGIVGASDLLALLAAWGPCPSCGSCDADLDCDGSVGGSDLLILDANWGPCSGSGGGTALEQAVQEMGFPAVPAYQAWLAQASDPECFASGCLLYTILQNQE